MKYIILFLLLPFLSFSQGGTWPVKYNDSDPSGTPSASGTRVYFNTATNTLFFWEPAPSSTWRKQPKAFDQISGCAAPAYTPSARQSTFTVNTCTTLQNGHGPELYQYTGVAWECLNCVESIEYTAGTGIDITGDVITNTLPNIVQTLSIAGQDLTLSGGGGTVAIPGVSVAGSSGDIQFKNGTALGASSNLNWNGASLDLTSDEYALRIISGSSLLKFGNGCFYSCNEIGLFDGDDRAIFLEDFDNQRLYLGTATVQDFSTNTGLQYLAYYPDIESNPQSLTDVQTVNNLKQKLATYTIAQRNAIPTPATGYVIFCTDATATDGSTGVMQVWNGSAWKNAW